MILSSCPASASLTAIGNQDCRDNFGQTVKIIFQRKFSTGNTRNRIDITGANEHTLLATFTPLIAAADGTKMVVSPFVYNPENTSGERLEEGGGNASVDGIPVLTGQGPGEFTGMFHAVAQQDIIKNIKTLMGEELQVYIINEHGQYAGETDSATAPTYIQGFPIRSFFVGDKVLGGFEAEDKNEFKFYLPPNWSNNWYTVTPADFNARDLVG